MTLLRRLQSSNVERKLTLEMSREPGAQQNWQISTSKLLHTDRIRYVDWTDSILSDSSVFIEIQLKFDDYQNVIFGDNFSVIARWDTYKKDYMTTRNASTLTIRFANRLRSFDTDTTNSTTQILFANVSFSIVDRIITTRRWSSWFLLYDIRNYATRKSTLRSLQHVEVSYMWCWIFTNEEII